MDIKKFQDKLLEWKFLIVAQLDAIMNMPEDVFPTLDDKVLNAEQKEIFIDGIVFAKHLVETTQVQLEEENNDDEEENKGT